MGKLCYILPEYNERSSDHFYHLYEFLEELSKKLDIFLIAEKSKNVGLTMSHMSHIKKFYGQRFRFLPLRFLESFLAVLWARISGYKNFYTHYCYIGGINAGFISRLLGGKSHYWHCEMLWEFKQKIFSKLGFNLALKLSHFLITGSEKLKKEYAKRYGLKLDNIRVMPNWINLDRFNISSISSKRSDQTSNKIILFVHWLSERKGAHLLVPIIKQLIDNLRVTDYELQVTVIGGGPLKEKIVKEIKEHKLEDHVRVLGKIPNKDLAKYYAEADIFILPSLQEGFPRVLLEAMASGVPYVAFDVGAVREMSPEIAQDFIVHPVRYSLSNEVERGNIEKFAEKIKILLSDEEIYNQFKKEELGKVKEYSLDKVVDKFIDLFVIRNS